MTGFILKTERRHELQTNDLAESLSHIVEALRPYGRVIGGLVVIGLFSVWFTLRLARPRWAASAQMVPLRLDQGGGDPRLRTAVPWAVPG